MTLAPIDLVVVVLYAIGIFGLAQWVSREKPGHQKDSSDYFLASKNLPWWAIGASLIAANISAEQIVGMSGSGYAIGLAIASYEWMAALTLLIVGKWFLPIFLANKIYTMPQFLEQRFGPTIRTVMAVFWLVLYIFVNLTAIIWLGSIAVTQVAGVDQDVALFGLGTFALLYQLRGGLKAVALTDIVQVTLLVFGGLVISYLTLGKIARFTRLANLSPARRQDRHCHRSIGRKMPRPARSLAQPRVPRTRHRRGNPGRSPADWSFEYKLAEYQVAARLGRSADRARVRLNPPVSAAFASETGRQKRAKSADVRPVSGYRSEVSSAQSARNSGTNALPQSTSVNDPKCLGLGGADGGT